MKPWNLVGCNGSYRTYSLETFFDAQVALGVKRVALVNHPAHLWLDRRGAVDLAQCRRALADRDLTVAALLPLPLQYSLCAGAEGPCRTYTRDYLHACAQTAAELGAPALCLRPFGALRDEGGALARLTETLSELCPFAAALGVRVLLQSEWDSGLVPTLAALAAVVEGVPGLGALLDTVAMSAAGEDIPQWFDRLGPALALVRFADGRGDGWRCWGEGVFPGDDYLNALAAAGYTGDLLLGDRSERHESDPVGADRRNLARVRALMGNCEGSEG